MLGILFFGTDVKSYCCEKINVQGEVFKEKDYTICAKNFHAMGQLKLLKTCSLFEDFCPCNLSPKALKRLLG